MQVKCDNFINPCYLENVAATRSPQRTIPITEQAPLQLLYRTFLSEPQAPVMSDDAVTKRTEDSDGKREVFGIILRKSLLP